MLFREKLKTERQVYGDPTGRRFCVTRSGLPLSLAPPRRRRPAFSSRRHFLFVRHTVSTNRNASPTAIERTLASGLSVVVGGGGGDYSIWRYLIIVIIIVPPFPSFRRPYRSVRSPEQEEVKGKPYYHYYDD